MIFDDSFSTLESWNDGKLHDFEDEALPGDDQQQEPSEGPAVPSRSSLTAQASTASRTSSEASIDLDLIWAEEEATDHTSQETNAYSSSLSDMEQLEQSLDQDMIGILNNQASVTELRISAIQSFLKLQNGPEKTKKKGRKCLRKEDGLSVSMRELSPKKSCPKGFDYQNRPSAYDR
ncbi:MAG: hypothetical protein SGARI_004989 [Bacillariaceae sp.]